MIGYRVGNKRGGRLCSIDGRGKLNPGCGVRVGMRGWDGGNCSDRSGRGTFGAGWGGLG